MAEQLQPLINAEPYLQGPDMSATRAGSLVLDAMERYSEPWRRHHVVDHMCDVIGFLLENVDELDNPRRTLWAAIDHDIVYVPEASLAPGANERRSAQLNQQRLDGLLPTEEVDSSGAYIIATADHSWDGQDMDLAYLLDADLKILGAPEDEFDKFDDNIWEEYKEIVDLDTYNTNREGILRGFYDKKRLFITDAAHKQFEDQAKANLERRLSRF